MIYMAKKQTIEKIKEPKAAKALKPAAGARGRKPRQAAPEPDSPEQQLSDIREKYEYYFSHVRSLEMLLAAFGALTGDGTVDVKVPRKGTPYWYIRSFMGPDPCFKVEYSTWIGGYSDKFRFVKGDFFLDEKVANKVCHALNAILVKL